LPAWTAPIGAGKNFWLVFTGMVLPVYVRACPYTLRTPALEVASVPNCSRRSPGRCFDDQPP
jgi:hypothetical protein